MASDRARKIRQAAGRRLVQAGAVVGRVGRAVGRPIAGGAAGGVLGFVLGTLTPSQEIAVGKLLEKADAVVPKIDAIAQMDPQKRIKKYGSEEMAREVYRSLLRERENYFKEAERVTGKKLLFVEKTTHDMNKAALRASAKAARERRSAAALRNAVIGFGLGGGATKLAEWGVKRRRRGRR